MIDIKKFTLGYDKLQDRISLTAECPGNEVMLLWLTQRLLTMLVQALLRCLDKEMDSAVTQGGVAGFSADRTGFAQTTPRAKNTSPSAIIPQLHALEQSAAQAAHKPEKPVQASAPTEGFLLKTIELKQMPKGYLLVCRWSDDGAVRLVMDGIQMRQFMGMLYRVIVSADWPRQLWPAWFSQEHALESLPKNAVLH